MAVAVYVAGYAWMWLRLVVVVFGWLAGWLAGLAGCELGFAWQWLYM